MCMLLGIYLKNDDARNTMLGCLPPLLFRVAALFIKLVL